MLCDWHYFDWYSMQPWHTATTIKAAVFKFHDVSCKVITAEVRHRFLITLITNSTPYIFITIS